MYKTCLILLTLVAAPLAAQQAPAGGPAPAPAPDARRVAGAAALTGQVRLDGRLDDAAWAAAEPLSGFTQAYPNPGAP